MQTRVRPTTDKNVISRLFFRFFLCYFIAGAAAALFAARGVLWDPPEQAGKTEFLFVLLALLGSVLTLAKPYLLLLTAVKAFFDVALLASLLPAVRGLSRGFLTFNACLCYVIFSLALFCTAAARSCLFSAEGSERDLRLLCSRRFLVYLAEAVLFAALALTLYFLWPQLTALFIKYSDVGAA